MLKFFQNLESLNQKKRRFVLTVVDEVSQRHLIDQVHGLFGTNVVHTMNLNFYSVVSVQ